jgi:hypothetical protein
MQAIGIILRTTGAARMNTRVRSKWALAFAALLVAQALGISFLGFQAMAQSSGQQSKPPDSEPRKLSHEETLEWISKNKAWRLAKKTKPIWARPVEVDEVGKEFQTADHVKEKARAGVWLCVGVAGEPWFQSLDKIEAKYDVGGQESKKFDFDTKRHPYRTYKPKGTVRNWVAQVKGRGIAGFYIRPGYDPERPLYSPVGGYVVKSEVKDPYNDDPKDLWLVQQSLFDSTYELVRDREPEPTKAERRR